MEGSCQCRLDHRSCGRSHRDLAIYGTHLGRECSPTAHDSWKSVFLLRIEPTGRCTSTENLPTVVSSLPGRHPTRLGSSTGSHSHRPIVKHWSPACYERKVPSGKD